MAATSRDAPAINIVQAVRDPSLIGDELSVVQEALLRSIYGLDIPEEQVAIVEKCTGRAPLVGVEYREIAVVAGRRSGKSDKIASNICLYEALIRQHRLSPGENGTVLLLARDQRQARVVRGYIEAKLTRSPILSQFIEAMRGDEIVLTNGIVIAIYPASFRSIRGLSVITAVLDEVAFWPVDENYASPDAEVLKALRPATATHERAKIVLVSSPYSRDGVLWQMFVNRDNDPDTLVWHSESLAMNPTISEKFLEKERARDFDAYRREYLAEFTDAVSAFLPSDAIQACTVRGRLSVPHSTVHAYTCSIDAAFKGDRFTLAVAHLDRDSGKVVIDRLESWLGSREAPLSLAQVLPSIKAIATQYGFSRIAADQFAIEPLRHAFAQISLTLEEQTFSAPFKADLYGNLRTLLTDRRIELLDHPQSLKELRSLEVELLPGGQSRIGHARRAGASDDFADVIALAAMDAMRGNGTRAFDPESAVIAGPPSIWMQAFPSLPGERGGRTSDDWEAPPGFDVVGRMNDRGGFDRVGGW
ncbi:MAG: hypothetical protein ACKVU1_02720 [bacterium]